MSRANIRLVKQCMDTRTNSVMFHASEHTIMGGWVEATGRFHYMSPDSDVESFVWPSSSILCIHRLADVKTED